MKTEITILIVTSSVTLLCVIINVIVTSYLSKNQNKIELKKTKINVLENRRIALERVKSEISSKIIKTDGYDGKDENKLLVPIIVYFQEISGLLYSVGHYLNSTLVSEVEELNNTISQYVIDQKVEGTGNVKQRHLDLKNLEPLEKRIKKELSDKLREIENEISLLIK